jgi:hypothetical protein
LTAGHALHTHERFEFVVNAELAITWPLFGADQERVWAPGWQPLFIWPEQPADLPGMVFKVRHADSTAVWVNTLLDRTTGRIQYVYVIPDVLVTVISLNLKALGTSTHVDVLYERTALDAAANDRVSAMAANDRIAGAGWSRQINAYLRAP